MKQSFVEATEHVAKRKIQLEVDIRTEVGRLIRQFRDDIGFGPSSVSVYFAESTRIEDQFRQFEVTRVIAHLEVWR